MTFTTTCITCGTVKDAEGPWNTTVVMCSGCVETTPKMVEVYKEIKRQKALQDEGKMLSGLGVRPWDRERGAQTAERATVALRDIYAGLSMQDMLVLKTIRDQEA